MVRFGFAKALRRAWVAGALGVSVVPAMAQEDGAAQSEGSVNVAARSAVKQDSISAYQIRAGETEYLPGRLRVIDPRSGELRAVGTTGVVVIQNGQVVGRAETDIGGVAQLRNLRPGVYSVIAIGPDGMGVFGMEVLPPASGVASPSYRFDTILVPSADMAVAQQVIGGALAAPGAPAGGPAAPLPPIPASFKRQGNGLIAPVPLGGGYEGDGGDAAAPIKGDVAVIPRDERMVSHLVVLDPATGQPIPMANSRVFFLRGGQLLGTIETNSEGLCGATGVEDGVYSMVGIGPTGFIALGVQVSTIAGPATAGEPATATTYVSMLQGGVPTVDLRAAGASSDALPFAPGFGGPGPFGPFGPGGPGLFPGGGGGGPFGGGGGGFAGGGGGFGGGGLLGALLGAGLGAGIGAAIADDDDDSSQDDISPAGP